jgi:hypothetical protein
VLRDQVTPSACVAIVPGLGAAPGRVRFFAATVCRAPDVRPAARDVPRPAPAFRRFVPVFRRLVADFLGLALLRLFGLAADAFRRVLVFLRRALRDVRGLLAMRSSGVMVKALIVVEPCAGRQSIAGLRASRRGVVLANCAGSNGPMSTNSLPSSAYVFGNETGEVQSRRKACGLGRATYEHAKHDDDEHYLRTRTSSLRKA